MTLAPIVKGGGTVSSLRHLHLSSMAKPSDNIGKYIEVAAINVLPDGSLPAVSVVGRPRYPYSITYLLAFHPHFKMGTLMVERNAGDLLFEGIPFKLKEGAGISCDYIVRVYELSTKLEG